MGLRYKLLIGGLVLGLATLFGYVRYSGDEEPKDPTHTSERAHLDDIKDSLEGKLTVHENVIPTPRPFYNDSQTSLGSDYDGQKLDQGIGYDDQPDDKKSPAPAKPNKIYQPDKTENHDDLDNETAENPLGFEPNGLEENLKLFEDLRNNYYNSGGFNFVEDSPENAEDLVSLYLEAGDYQRAINLLSTIGDYDAAFAVAKEYLESGVNNADATHQLCTVGLEYLKGICGMQDIQPPENILGIVVGACETDTHAGVNYKDHLRTICPALVDKEALNACHTSLAEVDEICDEGEFPSEELTAYALEVCLQVGKYITLLERDNICTRMN